MRQPWVIKSVPLAVFQPTEQPPSRRAWPRAGVCACLRPGPASLAICKAVVQLSTDSWFHFSRVQFVSSLCSAALVWGLFLAGLERSSVLFKMLVSSLGHSPGSSDTSAKAAEEWSGSKSWNQLSPCGEVARHPQNRSVLCHRPQESKREAPVLCRLYACALGCPSYWVDLKSRASILTFWGTPWTPDLTWQYWGFWLWLMILPYVGKLRCVSMCVF